jgi:hypothetical protein
VQQDEWKAVTMPAVESALQGLGSVIAMYGRALFAQHPEGMLELGSDGFATRQKLSQMIDALSAVKKGLASGASQDLIYNTTLNSVLSVIGEGDMFARKLVILR